MTMEYVVVKYMRERDVYLDGRLLGKTGDTLLVAEGTHVFHLGDPKDYAPESQEVVVQDTVVTVPLVLEFLPKEDQT
jgi:hypothetical protein